MKPGPSQAAKEIALEHGVKGFTITKAVEMTEKCRRTLENWYHSERALFDLVILGCVTKLKE